MSGRGGDAGPGDVAGGELVEGVQCSGEFGRGVGPVKCHQRAQDVVVDLGVEVGELGFPSQRGEILLRERSSPVEETRRKFDSDFKEGAVRLVRETGKPIARVARELGIKEGTLGNWVNADRRRRQGGDGQLGEDERAELARLRKENAELAMRCDVLKRSVALWVQDAMGR